MIKQFLSKRRVEVDADTSEARILNNEFLKNSYFAIYRLMQKDLSSGSRIVEIGGAGGIAKSFNPNTLVTDIRKSKNTDIIVNGENLPFENESIDAIWAKDSIHHMLNPQKFFQEASRTLKPGGILSICEPYWSPLGKFIYKNLHPEIWSEKEILNGKFTENGNQALAYCIFDSNPEKFSFVYDNFNVQEMHIVNGLSWILSGGATLTTIFPIKLLKMISQFETRKIKLMKFFGMNIVIKLRKIK